jgi:hypothetical protein
MPCLPDSKYSKWSHRRKGDKKDASGVYGTRKVVVFNICMTFRSLRSRKPVSQNIL